MYSYDCPIPEIEDCKSKMDMLKERIITMQKCQRKQIFDYAINKNELENKNKILSQRIDSLTNEMKKWPEEENKRVELVCAKLEDELISTKLINTKLKEELEFYKQQNNKLQNMNNNNNTQERETELIKLQASIIRGLRKETNEIKSSYNIIKRNNNKLRKDNELLEDILLCRCRDNTGQ